MRKYRKFTEGGATDPLEEYNKGENLDTTPGPKARRDSEEVVDEMGTASKFRRNLETGDLYSEEPITRPSAPKAKPAAKAASAPSSAPAPSPAPAARAEIPRSAASAAPKSTGENTSGPSNMDRIFMGLGAGAGVLGAAKLAQLSKTEKAAKAAKETAKAAAAKFSSPQARQTTSETGRKFGPKAEMEAAESTMRGAVGRKDIQAKRAATAKGRAETMESKKPVMQATPKKPSPRARTRDEDTDYELRARGGRVGYANGGQVRGSGCEQRGLRKCKVV
jgi:hypothetical protein